MFIGVKDAPKTAKGSRYEIIFSAPQWELKKDKRSDFIFQNMNDGRIMLSNSFCGEFQEESLENLANKTFKTISDFRRIKGIYTTFYDREAYRIEGIGQVDGVTVSLELLNTRRNNCYFDFLAIFPKGTEKESDSFNNFLKAVSFK